MLNQIRLGNIFEVTGYGNKLKKHFQGALRRNRDTDISCSKN